MSFIPTLAAPIAPEAPSFAPADDVRFQPDRDSTFGPALSDARERLASPEARRSDFAERRPATPERSESPDRSDRSDRPAPTNRSESADRSERSDRPERSSERPETPDRDTADKVAEKPTEDAAENEEPTADAAPVDDAAIAAEVIVPSNVVLATAAATILPTAKGAAGDGDPSTDLTVEEVATPDSLADAVETDASVIADGVTDVDLDALTAGATETAEAEVGEMGRQAALTSLEQVSDADLSLADRIRPATTEEVAGPAIALEESDRADPFAQAGIDEAADEALMRGRVDEANTDRADAGSAEATVEEASETPLVKSPMVDGERVDRPVQQTTIGTVTRAETTDAVVVLAREATAPAEGVKSAAATQTPAALPPAAEANLWEDVRSAFDRIRTNGDGQELLMRLRPAELGELLVQIRTQGEHVSVRLVTSSAAAQQTLVDDRLRLAAELARAGFDEGSVDIGQSNTGDANQRGDQRGDGSEADRSGGSLGNVVGLDRVGTDTARGVFERREPIHTESGFRPGRTAQSTINLTL